jgi:3-hydroxyacyl-[acyl-carrier-protein] dehydratase
LPKLKSCQHRHRGRTAAVVVENLKGHQHRNHPPVFNFGNSGDFGNLPRLFYNFRFDEMTDTTHANPSDVSAAESKIGPLDILQIQALLPHRYPFLLIDKVLEIERKKKVVAFKNVTINEPFFAGHFPGNPIMPGVLIVEAMAQAGAVLLLSEFPDRNDKLVFFTGIERARFRRPVVPGDQLRIEVTVLAWRSVAGRMDGKVFVGDKLAAEAMISCAVVDRPGKGGAQASTVEAEPAE